MNTRSDVVTPAALDPIVIDLVVPCPPERAFDYFTRDIGRWWPLATHSCGEADAVALALEPRIGGLLVEHTRDGTRHVWGEVTAWEPGRRVAFTWHPGRGIDWATHVDVAFAAHPSGTRVTLTHDGWDARDDGARARENYADGWRLVLVERFGRYCSESAMPAQ